jgi:hypothetical protein
MEHFERIWQMGLIGKLIIILLGFVSLAIIVGIPVGIIILFTEPGPQPAQATQPTAAPALAQASPTDAPTAAPATFTPVVTATPVPSITPTPLVQLTITNTNDFVNIRSGPGLTYTVISRLNKGQTATVLGRNADASWWLIEINTVRGWVYGLLVIPSGDPGAVPTSQAVTP